MSLASVLGHICIGSQARASPKYATRVIDAWLASPGYDIRRRAPGLVLQIGTSCDELSGAHRCRRLAATLGSWIVYVKSVMNTEFWGASFLSEEMSSAAQRILKLGQEAQAMPIRLINANSIAIADDNAEYRCLVSSSGINYPDGMPLAAFLTFISKMGGGPRLMQVRGPSLFERTMSESDGSDVSHLFFGGSPETIEELKRNIAEKFPRLRVAGYVSPPMAAADSLIELASKAHEEYGGDVIWLGLGQPKQDFVAQALAHKISRPCVGVGAAFDFVAGRVGVAPRWMQSVGLEWLYRLVEEPGRLWRRYTFGNARFLKVAVTEVLKNIMRPGR